MNESLKQLNIVVGDQDFALDGSKALSEVFKKHGIEHQLQITEGGHTWINWRQYLRDMGQRLFREDQQLAAHGIGGKWLTEFDTQIGRQKYVFDLHIADGKITGAASADIAGDQYESQIVEGSIDGDQVQFVEDLDFQGNALRIEYSGALVGEELQLERNVADIATEELVARRLDESADASRASEASEAQ